MKKGYFALMAVAVLSLAGCQANKEVSTLESIDTRADSTTVSSVESTAAFSSETTSVEETSSEASQTIKAGVWFAGDSYYFFTDDGKSGSIVDFQKKDNVDFEYELDESGSIAIKKSDSDAALNGTLKVEDEDDISFEWEDGTSQQMLYVSSKTADEFTFYSDDELIEAAKKHYMETDGDPVPDSMSVVNNKDGYASVLLFVKESSSPFSSYRLNRMTLTGTNSVGDAADLRDYAPNK